MEETRFRGDKDVDSDEELRKLFIDNLEGSLDTKLD